MHVVFSCATSIMFYVQKRFSRVLCTYTAQLATVVFGGPLISFISFLDRSHFTLAISANWKRLCVSHKMCTLKAIKYHAISHKRRTREAEILCNASGCGSKQETRDEEAQQMEFVWLTSYSCSSTTTTFYSFPFSSSSSCCFFCLNTFRYTGHKRLNL